MNELVNHNALWSNLLVTALETYGIKYACLSPGSRNTPLVLAFQKSKKIKCFVHIDERSSGFFAIGLVKQTKAPVVLVTTSGSAVTELYPAIVEAYYKHIPLFILTADRPPAHHNIGASQTINQTNIFKNHVMGFYEAGMPKINKPSLFAFSKKISVAVTDCISKKGPVHFNFPFEKPFEPSVGTEDIGKSFVDYMHREFSKTPLNLSVKSKATSEIHHLIDLIANSTRTVIIVGNSKYKEIVSEEILKLAKNINAPVFADGFSNTRYLKKQYDNVILNYASFLQSRKVRRTINPKLIIQFGDTPISKDLQRLFKESTGRKFLVNRFGEIQDPTRTATDVITAKTDFLCRIINANLPKRNRENVIDEQNEFYRFVQRIDKGVAEIKRLFLESTAFPFEGNIINSVLNLLPEESNLMISNSMPARDFDYFAEYDKKIRIFNNRGVSGIDGVISTAAGIAAKTERINALIIGDLAFYYDINGLLALKKYNIPLIIVLLNNGGGGIFDTLPIAKEKDVNFIDYFKTPIDIDFKSIVKGFGGNYKEITSASSFEKEFKGAQKKKEFTVLEIATDSKTSQNEREKFWTVIKAQAEVECDTTE
jgi:2-succinyl-5-enolpyruvyl-6-hydroxy-3-cyclohexene-1-carboxylate synthase